MTNSETGGCHGNTVHANETDNYTCLCCSREGAQRSSEEGWLVLPGRSGSSQVRQMQTAGLSVAGHAGLPGSGGGKLSCACGQGRAGQTARVEPCNFLAVTTLCSQKWASLGVPRTRSPSPPLGT